MVCSLHCEFKRRMAWVWNVARTEDDKSSYKWWSEYSTGIYNLGHFSVGERVTLKWILIQITHEIVGWIYLTDARFRRYMESVRKLKALQ